MFFDHCGLSTFSDVQKSFLAFHSEIHRELLDDTTQKLYVRPWHINWIRPWWIRGHWGCFSFLYKALGTTDNTKAKSYHQQSFLKISSKHSWLCLKNSVIFSNSKWFLIMFDILSNFWTSEHYLNFSTIFEVLSNLRPNDNKRGQVRSVEAK